MRNYSLWLYFKIFERNKKITVSEYDDENLVAYEKFIIFVRLFVNFRKVVMILCKEMWV